MSAFESFLGSAVGNAAGYAAGRAVGPVLAPLLQALRNETWSAYPDAPLDALLLARAVAEGKLHLDADAYAEASFTGVSNSRFYNLVQFVKNGPGVAAGMELTRRGLLDVPGFTTVLQRAGLEDGYVTVYTTQDKQGLYVWEQPLSVADIALGVIRNNIANADAAGNPIAQEGLPLVEGNVKQNPVSGINAELEAALAGVDLDRLSVLVNNVGLPPGVIEGLRMLRRNIITEGDFALLIAQSDARLAWGPALIQLRDEILTAHEVAEARVRDWIKTDAEMFARGAADGYPQAEMQLLYDMTGRPISYRNVFLAGRRGGTFDGPTDEIDPPYLESLRQSNLRPEWYSYAWALRFAVPPLFFVRQWLKDGHSQDQARTWLSYLGFSVPDQDAIISSYAKTATPGGTPVPDTHLKSAITTTVTEIRKAYVGGQLTADQANDYIASAEAATTLVGVWDILRTVSNLPPAPVA